MCIFSFIQKYLGTFGSNYFDLDSEHRANVDHVPLNYKRKRKMNLGLTSSYGRTNFQI